MFFPSSSPAAEEVAVDGAHPNGTCRELSWQLARTCAGVLVGTLERQHAAVVETVVLAAEASRAAEWWQLAAGSLISASLLYHHGRWMVWILLSIGILSVQALYVGWQTCMIFFNVVLCTLPPLSCCFRLRSSACLLLPAPPGSKLTAARPAPCQTRGCATSASCSGCASHHTAG